MIRFALMATFFAVRADPDNYHTTDAALLTAKKRLLAAPNDQGGIGGIRARLADESISVAGLTEEYPDVQQGTQVLANGNAYVEPLFDGIAAEYKQIGPAISTLLSTLDTTKEKTDKAVSQFAQDWASTLQKRMQTDPQQNDAVFNYYNTFILQMYGLLDRLSNLVAQQINAGGATLAKADVQVMAVQNATLQSEARTVSTGQLAFSRMLDGNALPTIGTAKLDAAGNIALVKKAELDSTDNFNSNIIPGVQATGSVYFDAGGNQLLLSAQKQVVAFTTQVQKSLVKMRSLLGQMAQQNSTAVSRNLTSIDTMRTAGAQQIANNRKAAAGQINTLIANALGTLQNFKGAILDSMGDVGQMLSQGDTELTAATTAAKLNSDQLNAQSSAAVAALFSPAVQGAGGVPGANSLQSQISSLFNSQTSSVASTLTNSVQGQIASALSDAEDASANSASLFAAVPTNGGAALDGKIGVQTAQLQAQQGTAASRVTDSAADVQSAIDSATADNEDDQAGILNTYVASSTSKDAVMGKLSDLAAQIATKKTAAQTATLVASGDILAGLSASQSTLGDQDSAIDSMQQRLTEVAGNTMPALDAQNEARISDAYGQINSLRRLSAGNGDLLQSNSTRMIANLVRQALAANQQGGGFSVGASNLSALSASVAGVKSAGTAYSMQAAAFEADMTRRMNNITAAARNSSASAETPMEQVVAQSNNLLASVGRDLIRSIYKNAASGSLANWIGTNPKFNVNNYLGYLLNDTNFQSGVKIAQGQMVTLGAKTARTKQGIDQYVQYLLDMKNEIQAKYFFNSTQTDAVQQLANFKAGMETDLVSQKQDLNASIANQFQFIDDAIANKTSNFYKEFQTSSIIADSIVQGFSDYIDKMISVENMTAVQRAAMEAQMISSIQDGVDAMPANISSANDIQKVNDLVAIAMNASDTSAAGMQRRAAANKALLAMVGTSAAVAMEDRYTKLAANAAALSSSIESSRADLVSDRVGSLAGSQMGIDGINNATQLFSNQAGDVLETQKANAKQLADKIDQLMGGSGFLTNISASEFGEILKSIQDSDNLHSSQQSSYQEADGSQVATIGGVVQDFAQLVTIAINETTDYLNQLSANYTDLVTRTDAVTIDPVNSIKQNVSDIGDAADNVKSELNTQLLSIAPIQDGLSERMAAMLKQQDDFAENTQTQLASFVANVQQMESDISTSRQAGMNKLQTAISSLLANFRSTALDLQSSSVDSLSPSSLIEIKQDINNRLREVRSYVQGRQ